MFIFLNLHDFFLMFELDLESEEMKLLDRRKTSIIAIISALGLFSFDKIYKACVYY